MGLYRKKPLVIEAFQFTGPFCGDGIPQWYTDAFTRNEVIGRGSWKTDYVEIKTLEGWLRADKGCWIIRGINGELYPCDDEIFRATYDPVTEENRGELRTVEQAVIPAPDGRQPIATAPKDGTHIIIAVTCLGRVPVIGSAYWQAGDWWWAGTGPTFYGSCPVSEANFGAPEFWWPMPTLGA